MKIAFLMHSYYEFNRGGAEYQAFIIAKELLKFGFDIHFIFLQEGHKKSNENDIKLHPIKKIRSNIFSDLKLIYFYKIYYRLSQIKPNVIYHRNLSSFLYVANCYAKLNEIKTILHISHDKDVEKFRWSSSVKQFFRCVDDYYKFRALRKVDAIICQTSKQKSILLKNYDRASVVIPNFYEPCHLEKNLKKDNIVVWIANIKPWKNPLDYVKLAKALDGKEYKFVMIGRRPSQRSLYRKIWASLSQPNVEYLGELDNSAVNKILLRSKVLCCTSYAEGFPNTFLQAWVRKVPVVSLYFDPDNILVNEQIGFHSNSFEQMVEDTKRLMEDEELRNNMGERAQKYAFKNHSLANIENIVKIIDRR
jgi:glycosyltransferase involved in cell wall biosynthesis